MGLRFQLLVHAYPTNMCAQVTKTSLVVVNLASLLSASRVRKGSPFLVRCYIQRKSWFVRKQMVVLEEG